MTRPLSVPTYGLPAGGHSADEAASSSRDPFGRFGHSAPSEIVIANMHHDARAPGYTS